MKHTPGPWQSIGANHLGDYPVYPEGGAFAIAAVHWRFEDEAEANARLIAAAPELLAALKDLVGAMDTTHGARRSQQAAKEVIAKVEGGE